MAKAKREAVEAWLAERLTKQAERWRQARELRAYCDALEDRIAATDSDADKSCLGEQVAVLGASIR